ncbi:hypothetical protein G7046_g7385 [Stylonectria norvegica]|nr:hypothetical protein G7046_g7385 [Stylonectria norvegica]
MSILSLLHNVPTKCSLAFGVATHEAFPEHNIPSDLQPTFLQKSTPHSFWIDAIPFPAMRDNLILLDGTFDSDDLRYDLGQALYEGFDDVERRGCLVWGDPWRADGWEITEGFAKKWEFLLSRSSRPKSVRIPSGGRSSGPSRSSSTRTRPHSTYGASESGLLKPPTPGGSSRRSSSRDADAERRSRPLSASGPRHDRHGSDEASEGTTRWRSVSPSTRRAPSERHPRASPRRDRRDSIISDGDDSRQASRRSSLSPAHSHEYDGRFQGFPSQDQRHQSLSTHQGPLLPPPGPPMASTGTHHTPNAQSGTPYGSRRPSPASPPPRVLQAPPRAHGASTPPKYKPQGHTHDEHSSKNMKPDSHDHGTRPSAGSRHDSNSSQASKTGHTNPASPKPSHSKPAAAGASHGHETSGKGKGLLGSLSKSIATYASLESLTHHADIAKEWADWLKDIRDAPEEMQALSDKAKTAQDTISQIQTSVKARPDLLEGESGVRLKGQIEATIKSTDAVLSKMTTMLQDLNDTGAKHGNILDGLAEFYNSYKYKHEWEDKIKESDAELQKELGVLSTLMMAIYSRSLVKPSPAVSPSPLPSPLPSSPKQVPENVQKQQVPAVTVEPPTQSTQSSEGEDAPEAVKSDVESTKPEQPGHRDPSPARSSISHPETPHSPWRVTDVEVGGRPSPSLLAEEEENIGVSEPLPLHHPPAGSPPKAETKTEIPLRHPPARFSPKAETKAEVPPISPGKVNDSDPAIKKTEPSSAVSLAQDPKDALLDAACTSPPRSATSKASPPST